VTRPSGSRRLPLAALLALGLAACSASPGQHREGPRGAPADAEPPGAVGGDEDLVPAEVATIGWDGLSNAPLVLLREMATGHVVPIWVGVAEARAIAAALHGVEFPRPMTHDLMRDLVAGLGGRLQALHIHDLRDGTYYGRLELRVEGREAPLLVDTRPSDGMALALRSGAEIRVARRILDETPDFDFLAPDAGDQVVSALGLTLVAPTAAQRRELALPERLGLVVRNAVGAAARAGVRRGDFVVEVGGVAPETPMDFLEAVRAAPFAAPIPVTYWRDGEEATVELLPEPAPRRREPRRVRIA
jgi:bifunctional DNase/RNase